MAVRATFAPRPALPGPGLTRENSLQRSSVLPSNQWLALGLRCNRRMIAMPPLVVTRHNPSPVMSNPAFHILVV